MDTTTYLTEGTLSHGLRVAVRPMAPGDRTDLIDGFSHLSEETRYRRFMTSKARLTDADIARLFDTDELALVLVWPRTSCKDIVLGIAHAIRVNADTAEFCICITDEIQGRGAGRLLTHALADAARERGFSNLSGFMLGSNEAPARLLRSVGTVVEDHFDSGTREMTVRLT